MPGAWLVGGSVRDLLLGRPVTDIDLVVDGDPAAAARSLARTGGGSPFPLSERHGAWRVVREGDTVDVARSRGSITDDLGLRDFTVNAIALPLDGGELLDPHDGRGDLDARTLRAVSDRIYDDDPLRLLRLVRLAHQLGFAIEPATLDLARARAALADRPSGERIFMELRRLLDEPDPADGLRLLDRVGALAVVLPELAATRGLEQNPYHQLDVLDHTLQVVDATADVAAHPDHYLTHRAGWVEERMTVVVGDDVPAWLALRFAALFHDIAKPQTQVPRQSGHGFGFPGHDEQGAEIARAVLGRWKVSAALSRFCSTMVAQHLRLGFAVRRRPLDRREAHRYRRATAPWEVESVVLSLADRLTTRGLWSKQRHLRAHAETADELLGLLAELRDTERPPLLRGDEIAETAGVSGRRIAELVDALAEEQAAGAVTTREEAVRFVRGIAL